MNFLKEAELLEKEIIETRRYLHAHPELSVLLRADIDALPLQEETGFPAFMLSLPLNILAAGMSNRND